MNKKILISLSIIGAVAAIGIGATVAYFNDTETSTGNIFVAGEMDLKVDHVLQTYNDVYCKTCSVEIQSDTSNVVTGTVDGADSVPFPHNAVAVSSPHPAWTVTGDIPGATWVWATDPTLQADTTQDIYYTFEKTFEWWGPVDGITLSLGVGTDNGYRVELNGNLVGEDMSEFNYRSPADTYSGFGSYLTQGQNTLEIVVKNKGMAGGTPATNPAGLLYKLVIDGQCDNDYFKNNCRLWGEKDLEQGDHFFNFTDIKPGDYGRNVISLHVYDNDAWLCATIDNMTNNDNSCVEPEEPEDTTCGETYDPNGGELAQNLYFFAWSDDGDSFFEPGEGETPLFSNIVGPASDVFNDITYPIADSSIGEPLTATTTYYIGLAWCAGDLIVNQTTGNLNCDAAGMGNDCQSDSLSADITFYAEQARNNPDYICGQ